jgi:MFS family permease
MSAAVSLIAAHVCSMLGFSTFAALLPQLRDAWSLTNSQAGVVGSMFFAGYIASVSHWTAFTDRADARKVYAAASLVAAAASAGFGWLANGFVSALVFQALLGVGIAGTYMPGLRLLSDRITGPRQSRAIAFYTASFGIGTALSFALAGAVASRGGWHMAFRAASVGPLIAAATVLSLRPLPRADLPSRREPLLPFASWRSILRRRDVAGYVLGYAVHCLELFGSRSWMVAFLAFSDTLKPAGARFAWAPQSIAALVNLLSVPSSIVGNEIALRVGRRRWILLAMGASGATGAILGISAPAAWPVLLALLAIYSMLVMAESATLTAGVVAAAPPELRGAALGLYSLAGFGGGLLGPVLFGAALDLAGGAGNRTAWVLGYAAIGSGCLAAPAFARWFARSRPAP